MGDIFSKLNDIQHDMHKEVVELMQNIEHKVLKPLNDYQVRQYLNLCGIHDNKGAFKNQ